MSYFKKKGNPYISTMFRRHLYLGLGVFTKPQKPHQNSLQNGITAPHHMV